jgi:CheY-like chemotaxis protein
MPWRLPRKACLHCGQPEKPVRSAKKALFYAAARRALEGYAWTDIQEPDQILSDDNNGIITGIAKLDNNEMILILDFEKMLFDINPETGIDERKVEHVDRSKHEDTPILIAEDSTLLRKMIVECLAKAGFTRINACINGQEAWDHLQHFRENGELNDKVQCIMDEVLSQTNLSSKLTEPLLTGEGELADLLKIVIGYEQADWSQAAPVIEKYRLNENQLSRFYLEALVEANSYL